MSKNLGQIVFTTDTWGDVVNRLNDVVAFANTEVVSANSTVGITGNTSSPVTAHVHGNVSATSLYTNTLSGGNNTVQAALTLPSATTVGNTFTANASLIRGLLTANAGLIVTGQANVGANTSVGGSLAVTGIGTFGGNVSAVAATFTGNVAGVAGVFSGALSGASLAINTTQIVTTTVANSVTVSANTIAFTAANGWTLTGNATITGNVAITGTGSISGNTTVSILAMTSNATANAFTVSAAVTNFGAGNLYIAANNNVGIGTTTPTKKLHVVGDAQLTGNTTQTGALSISANASVGGALTVTGNVAAANITGNFATLTGDVASNNATFTGNVVIASTGNLSVAAPTSSLQNVTAKAATFTTVTATGAVSISNTVASGNTTITGFANVTGNIQGASLTINGTAATGNLTAGTIGAQNTQVTNLTVTANANVTGTLTAGAINLGAGALVAGSYTATGNVTANLVISNTVTLQSNLVDITAFSNASLGTVGSKPFYAFPKGSYRSGQVLVEFWDGASQWQSSTLIVVNDGTNAYLTMYGTVSAPASSNSSPLLAEVTASINATSSNVELFANTHVANVRVKGAATLIKV